MEIYSALIPFARHIRRYPTRSNAGNRPAITLIVDTDLDGRGDFAGPCLDGDHYGPALSSWRVGPLPRSRAAFPRPMKASRID